MSDYRQLSVFSVIGASNHSERPASKVGYYATDPYAINYLLEGGAELNTKIWEPCCGDGALSRRLEEFGYDVKSSDLYDRGYGEIMDFLQFTGEWDGDILTNPPYKIATEIIEKALDVILPGNRVYLFLKLTFLESVSRQRLFETRQLKTLYVMTKRVVCAMDGDFTRYGKDRAIAYGWYEFQKGFNGDPVIKWINK